MKFNSLLLITSFPVASIAAQEAAQPNIIYILTDDMGIGDLSCYGSRLDVPTPNLDKMASEGVRFTQYYSASPISSPSRAGLLTGKHPANWNITSYLQSRKGNAEAEMADFLTTDAPTLPRALKAGGYKTGHFGKWHLGGGRDVHNAPSILEYGYDEYVSTYESPDPNPLLTATDWIWSDKDEIKRWDRTKYFVDKTIDFLKRNNNQPCFVNLWPDDMHTPWIGNEEQMEMAPDGDSGMHNFNTVLKDYDMQIGHLLERLKEEGLDKNTIVIFSSDNGPAPSFNHIRSNGLRGCKASLFEGGVRMPLIVWSGGNWIQKGRVDNTSVMSAMDMFYSLCALGKAPLPAGFNGDGEDMSKGLSGTPQKRNKAIYWEYKRNDGPSFPKAKGSDESPNVSVRKGDWKLLVNDNGKDVMLFNLKEDVYETHNVAKRHPDVVKDLKEKALKWRSELPKLSKDF